MNTTVKLALGTTLLIAGLLVATSSTAKSQSQNSAIGPINLQDATPGTAQVGHGNITGTFKAGYLKGNGLGVTGINANNVAVGILNDLRLSANVPLLNKDNTFAGATTFNGHIGIGYVPGQYAIKAKGTIVCLDDNTNGASLNCQPAGGYLYTHSAWGTSAYVGNVQNTRRGWIYVNGLDGLSKATMTVDSSNKGVLSADIKNFRVPNPRNDAEDIVYACVEGPEAAAYIRGTGHLVNGRAIVQLPQHFQDVSLAEGMTVQVTPGSFDSKGLAVMGKSLRGFEVGELNSGRGNYDFDWEVKCVRAGYRDYRVVRPWNENPSPGEDQAKSWATRQQTCAIRRSETGKGTSQP
ncbi:MAG: hypothetical protein JSS66_15850 [Armatimonadetes bacterium]|nr:hypothetical protein [Armatimonadota bacterium]